jgi:peptidoglycan/LPS O-acetylase OafA/YrhL
LFLILSRKAECSPIANLTPALSDLCAVALIALGILLLRMSWVSNRSPQRLYMSGGWLAVVAGFVLLMHVQGPKIGMTYAFLAFSLIAYAMIASTVELRRGKRRASVSLAPEPEQRPTNWRRATAKSLLAIVLAGVAAIGIGVAFAVAMPLPPQDRMVLGGLLVPVLWGGGMAWTLADAKLLRASVILAGISVVSYAIAFLPKLIAR